MFFVVAVVCVCFCLCVVLFCSLFLLFVVFCVFFAFCCFVFKKCLYYLMFVVKVRTGLRRLSASIKSKIFGIVFVPRAPSSMRSTARVCEARSLIG